MPFGSSWRRRLRKASGALGLGKAAGSAAMAGEWQETTLGALGSFRNGVNFNRSQEGLGLAVVKVKDFGERFFAPRSGYDELDPNAIDITESQLLHDGDVVIIRSNGNGNLLGRSLYVREPAGPLTFSGFCIRFRPNSSEISPGFAAYLIRSPFFRRRFTAFGSGTGIQNLSQEILGSVPVSLPPLPEQRAIAHILGTLDDKIELNRKMNETLEAMARAIFKSWFVDFDPVRAKMEGRWRKGESLPGLPAHFWEDLFPDRLVDSELGKIPEGWEAGVLGNDLAELVSGARPKGGAVEEGIPSVGAENVIGLGLYDFSKEKFIPHDFFEQLRERGAAIKLGDVLLYKDGAQIGRKTYFDRGFPHAHCAINEHCFILRLKHRWMQRYVFFWLDLPWITEEIVALNSNSASAQPGINQAGIRHLPLLRAQDAVIQQFDHLAQSFLDKIFENCHESRTLAAIRDALLPKLLSGEICVKDVKKIAEAHL